MNARSIFLAAVLAFWHLAAASPAAAAAIIHQVMVINGVTVDRYVWVDSKGRPRTVALKREGNGNPGHGGYAVQMSYQALVGGVWRTIMVNAPPGDGFGYFVSHERYRTFTDGSYNTIAGRIFGKDDSPLGLGFPVTGQRLANPTTDSAAHLFTLAYPRYGTVSPIAKNADGEDVRPTPISYSLSRLYILPVNIVWYFESGKDYPRILTSVSLANIPGPDRVNFDVRGPYGVLNFDHSLNLNIDQVAWGDRFYFFTGYTPLTRNRPYSWTTPYTGGRFTALIASGYEMGLFEPAPLASSALRHGFAFGRGKNSNSYTCTDAGNVQILPCDWEWPYQSAQYSLPYNNLNAPTTYKKIAWGSAAFYGAGPSMWRVWDSGTTWNAFNGFPSSKRIAYSVCVVLGRTISGGLTKAAAKGPSYNCALAP
jgi:hypothetical protein